MENDDLKYKVTRFAHDNNFFMRNFRENFLEINVVVENSTSKTDITDLSQIVNELNPFIFFPSDY